MKSLAPFLTGFLGTMIARFVFHIPWFPAFVILAIGFIGGMVTRDSRIK